jgi:hypothetical protein
MIRSSSQVLQKIQQNPHVAKCDVASGGTRHACLAASANLCHHDVSCSDYLALERLHLGSLSRPARQRKMNTGTPPKLTRAFYCGLLTFMCITTVNNCDWVFPRFLFTELFSSVKGAGPLVVPYRTLNGCKVALDGITTAGPTSP